MASHPCFVVFKCLPDGSKEVVKSGVTDEEGDRLASELKSENPGEVYGVGMNVDNNDKMEIW